MCLTNLTPIVSNDDIDAANGNLQAGLPSRHRPHDYHIAIDGFNETRATRR